MADGKKDEGQGNIRILRRVNLTIRAKHCLWFSWTPMTISGPEGEDETSRPEFDAVEDGADTVRITATDTSQKWRHHPDASRESGAGGLDGTGGIPNDSRGLENSAYKDSSLNSDGINELTTHLNKLVAIFEIQGAAPTPTSPQDQHIVGAGPTSLSIPAGASKIFIGFHDGRHWTNNDGHIDILLEWISSGP